MQVQSVRSLCSVKNRSICLWLLLNIHPASIVVLYCRLIELMSLLRLVLENGRQKSLYRLVLYAFSTTLASADPVMSRLVLETASAASCRQLSIFKFCLYSHHFYRDLLLQAAFLFEFSSC